MGKFGVQILVMLVLSLATVVAYRGVGRCEFTNYDDSILLLENPWVVKGLTLKGLWLGLTRSWVEYWHPVTWWSHMLDWEFFGPRAGWQHGVSLGFHVANTVLLFAVLRRMTGGVWRSGMVAGLFALHPTHVESVAWLAERKDVLSGLFFMLTLWAYVRYVERSAISKQVPGAAAADQRSRVTGRASPFYLLSLAFFALGLMSKPMVVTLPFVLLLLDYWPLHRFQLGTANAKPRTSLLPLLWEKLPFFALTAASCAITYSWAVESGNTLSAEKEPWGPRLANLPVSYARYLGKLLWPVDLAVVYPIPDHWAWWEVSGAVVILLLITAFVWRRARSAPYGVVGWLIFVGMLFPTIRLVQEAFQSIADRYTYLPSIGLFVAVVWGVGDWSAGWKGRRVWLGAAGGSVIGACLLLTRQQAGYWRDSETLFRHALAVTENNYFAHGKLGDVLSANGQTDAAISHFREALRLRPDDGRLYYNLGNELFRKGQIDEAIGHLREAVRLEPDYVEAHNNLANALLRKGQTADAIRQFQEAIRLQPSYADARYNLGVALAKEGKTDEAISQYEQAIRLKPDSAQAHNNLGNALLRKGRIDEAIGHFQEALRLKPDHANARHNLDAALAAQALLRASPPPPSTPE